MRLSKYLTLCAAMSRNQAKFFIRKGRLSVDGAVVTDPDYELSDASHVVFDGKPISIADYQYVVLHKPPSFSCTTRDTDVPSVLSLLGPESDDRYFYFVNTLGPDQTGLVLLSDDARWTNRLTRRLMMKPRVYRVRLSGPVSEAQLGALRKRWVAPEKDRTAPVVELQLQDETTLLLSIAKIDAPAVLQTFTAVDVAVEALHLQQIGKLSLGDLGEGDSLVLAENDLKV